MKIEENAKMWIHAHHFRELIQLQAKLEKERIQRNINTQNCRKRKKEAEEAQKNAVVLRTNPRQNHQDHLVSNVLEEISKLSIEERKVAVQQKFRTMSMYDIKKKDTFYIIQMEHNGFHIDWLKVAKPSVDKKGFGVFAMMDISEMKLVSLYLGDVFTTECEKNKAIGNEHYTLLSNVVYNDTKGWKRNKKRSMYVVPKMKKKTWKDKVDEIYMGGHLVNTYKGTYIKSANVGFSFFFQIYTTQNVKAGDELLINYGTKYHFGNLEK